MVILPGWLVLRTTYILPRSLPRSWFTLLPHTTFTTTTVCDFTVLWFVGWLPRFPTFLVYWFPQGSVRYPRWFTAVYYRFPTTTPTHTAFPVRLPHLQFAFGHLPLLPHHHTFTHGLVRCYSSPPRYIGCSLFVVAVGFSFAFTALVHLPPRLVTTTLVITTGYIYYH